MKKLNEKNIKAKFIVKALIFMFFIFLTIFLCFTKAGILFINENDIITVSTESKKFDPKRYVASVSQINIMPSTTTVQTSSQTTATKAFLWEGPILSKSMGVVIGPSGKETYYNLNMDKIVFAMRNLGYSENDYPYWIREDGVKMLGNYVMVAADYNIRPKGTILASSLGMAIVCDTGGFVKNNSEQIDIAVNW